jgi:hypothetical protein
MTKANSVHTNQKEPKASTATTCFVQHLEEPRPSTGPGLQCLLTDISSRSVSIATALADARELFAKENTSARES